MHAISSYRGNRPTNTQTHKHTIRQDRLQYTAPRSSARSVKICAGGRHTMPPPRANDDWRWNNCWRRDRLCSDLNSQPKRPGDLLTLKVVPESCDVGYLCAKCSLPRPLFLDLRSMYTTAVRRRQIDRRQTRIIGYCPRLGGRQRNKTQRMQSALHYYYNAAKHRVDRKLNVYGL